MVSLDSLFGNDAAVLHETDFQVLMLATVFPVLGTTLVSPVLDAVIEPFGTTPAQVGLLISFATAPAIVLIPIAGALADRYGRRPVMVGSLLVFGLAGSAIAATTDFRVVLGLRVLQGLGFAGLAPIITTSIGDMYDGTREATGQGLRMATNGVSGAVFPLLAGALVAVSWQLPFLLYGLAIPVAVVVYWWFDEPTDDTGAARDVDLGGWSYVRALLGVLRQRRVAAIVVARALPVMIWVAFLTLNSLIVVRLLDGTAFEAGVLAAVGNVVFAITGSQTGRITALLGSRLGPLLVGNACLAAGLAFVVFAPGIGVAIVGIAVAGVGLGLTLTLYRSLITGFSTADVRGGVVSLGAAGSRITATATPVALGAIIAFVEPTAGLAAAIRIAVLAATVVGAGGGIACILVAHWSPPVTSRESEPAGE